MFDNPEGNQEEAPWIIRLLALAIVFFILYASYKLFFGLLKEVLGMGTFSKFFKPSDQNKRLTFAVLGAHIIVSERDQNSEQYAYLSAYLRKHFPKLTPFSSDEIFDKHRIYPDFLKAAVWSAEFLDETERINLFDFLIDLGFYNGFLNRRETALLYHIGRILKFSDVEISSMLNIRGVHQEKARAHQQNKSFEGSSSSSMDHKQLKALKIMGLDANTKSYESVRKVYRELARKHHPDRYHNASAADQKLAHERFTEINWAHDYLKERLT